MKKNNRKKLFKGFSIGFFASGIILSVFSSLFSYTEEVNILSMLLFCIALLLWIYSQKNQEDNLDNKRWLTWPVKIIIPVTLSVLLIHGDFRSWLLVLISCLIVWFLV